MRQLLRVICLVVLIAVAVYTAAVIARAVGSGEGSSGTFWGAIGLLGAIAALCVYGAVRLGSRLG